MRDVGVAEMDLDLDEEDPSEAWVSQSLGVAGGYGGAHQPQGPLGSERPKGMMSPLSPITNGVSAMSGYGSSTANGAGLNGSGSGSGSGSGGKSQGIQIKRTKNKKDLASSPLTNSVQENFKGFTYHGGESVVAPMLASMARRRREGKDGEEGDGEENAEEAVDDEEVPEVTTEDEFEDCGKSAGRYANARRKGVAFMDDDMS